MNLILSFMIWYDIWYDMIWCDVIFIYCNLVSTRWQWTLNLYENRNESYIKKECYEPPSYGHVVRIGLIGNWFIVITFDCINLHWKYEFVFNTCSWEEAVVTLLIPFACINPTSRWPRKDEGSSSPQLTATHFLHVHQDELGVCLGNDDISKVPIGCFVIKWVSGGQVRCPPMR
jgi:hypothetical protein